MYGEALSTFNPERHLHLDGSARETPEATTIAMTGDKTLRPLSDPSRI